MQTSKRRSWGLGGMVTLLAVVLLGGACAPAGPAPGVAPTAGARPAAASGTAAAPAPPAAPVRVVVGRAGSGAAPQFWAGYVANAQGFFQDEGIIYEQVTLQSAFNLTQAVIAGELQVSNFTVLSTAAAVAGGAPLKLVAATQDVPTIEVIAVPSVRSWADLRGQTVLGGNSPGDYFDIAMRMMLAANGLHEGDYTIRSLPSSARLPTLQAGQAVATVAADRDAAVGIAQGLRSLGALNDYVKDVQFAGLMVDASWARTHDETLVRFLRALLRGSAWLFDPANADQAKRIYATVSDLDLQQVNDIYTDMIDKRMLSRTLRPSLTGIESVLAMAHQYGALEQIPPLDTWVDLSYLDKASQ
jgi:ABC-type nitrate/sulfonate/bicarbonate transport system substrate-binding protein